MRINNKYIMLVLIAMVFASCEVTNSDILVGGDGDANLSSQQFGNIDPPQSTPFFYQGTSEISVDLGKFEPEGSTISSVVVTKVLYMRDSLESTPAVYTLTGDSFSQTLAELFADVPVDGVVMTEDSLAPGDYWTLDYVINLEGNAPTTDNTLDVAITTIIPFSCVSEIPTDGTWTGETQNGAFGVFSTNTEVTLEVVDANGNYKISDMTGGFYANFGFETNQPANLNDLCNVISVTGAPDAQFAIGQNGLGGPGSWDAATETLTVTWYDSGNDIDEVTIHTRN